MNNRALTLSVLMALVGVFFIYSFVSSLEDEQRKRFGTEVLVAVAKQDLKEMQTVTEEYLSLEKIPKQFLEPNAIYFEGQSEGDEKVAKSLNEIAGAIALVPIKEGEQLTYSKLVEPSIRTGLSNQVTPGKRAVALPVDNIAGVSKLIKPGDRVDVLATLDLGGGQGNRITKMLLQDVSILSVGQYVTNGVPRIEKIDPQGKVQSKSLAVSFDYDTVTVEVEPREAVELAFVMSSGGSRIVLSLRNSDDSERLVQPVISLRDIVGGSVGTSRSRGPAGGAGR